MGGRREISEIFLRATECVINWVVSLVSELRNSTTSEGCDFREHVERLQTRGLSRDESC